MKNKWWNEKKNSIHANIVKSILNQSESQENIHWDCETKKTKGETIIETENFEVVRFAHEKKKPPK